MADKVIHPDEKRVITRRQFLGHCLRGAGVLAVGGLTGGLLHAGAERGDMVWQIDPSRCIGCDKCSKSCVINPSAVKCIHEQALCGYCNLCFGYFADQRTADTPGAENERCPTGAIGRSFVEDPYYQYVIDEPKCIGCGLCVKGCKTFGNSSLILQVRHDRCLNCNECAIAAVCPADAFVRVPAKTPYLLRVKNT
ncbi:MAG: ferredoxin [Armatimonadia bacterium]